MPNLFDDFEPETVHEEINLNAPLADRVRPVSIQDVVKQKHLIGDNAPLRLLFDNKEFPLLIF